MKTVFDKSLQFLFILYVIAAIITDVHHWYKAWQTSLPGRDIAISIVEKTGKPANKVYCIMVKDDNPKFSSFCVPTNEAIGWGRSVWAITGYKWPKEIQDTTLDCTPTAGQEAINLAYTIKKTNKFDDEYWSVGNKYYIRDSGYHWCEEPNNHNFGYWVTCDEYGGHDKDYCVFIYKKDFFIKMN